MTVFFLPSFFKIIANRLKDLKKMNGAQIETRSKKSLESIMWNKVERSFEKVKHKVKRELKRKIMRKMKSQTGTHIETRSEV